jgi:hypothetical protein
LVYSDFQAIARQLWASGVVDLESMEQVSGQEKAQLVCFQKFSYQPILNFSAPETFLDCLRSYSCAHAEFENVLDKICARCPAGNSGKAYAVFEVTDGILTVQGAPSKAVYIGSECEAGRAIGHNKTRHRSFIEDSSRKVCFLELFPLKS